MVARALLKDAPVMLFDEASSGFDVEANEYLYKIITEEMPEKSVIFITHHYDKLEKFDKVYLVKRWVSYGSENWKNVEATRL